MIDWLTRLPDGALGFVLAGSTWFGFNYAVLAERVMERDLARPAIEACVDHLAGQQRNLVVPRSGIGEILGMPELDQLEAALVDRVAPRALTRANIAAQCACAVASAPKLRMDYALHTASFRLIPVDSAVMFRGGVFELATSSACGSKG